MKNLASIFLLSLAAILSSISASAEKRHYHLSMGEFSELKVVDGINVDYVCDPSLAGTVEFMADKDMASSIMFEAKKGRLSIMLSSRTEPYVGLPTVTVYSSYLSKVTNEGDSLVRVLSVAPGAKFACKQMGNGFIEASSVKATDITCEAVAGHGKVTISGSANNLTLNVTGAGSINALQIPAPEVSCRLAGTGSIECAPQKLLTVSGLGGTLRYRGTPEIKKKLISKINLLPID